MRLFITCNISPVRNETETIEDQAEEVVCALTFGNFTNPNLDILKIAIMNSKLILRNNPMMLCENSLSEYSLLNYVLRLMKIAITTDCI